MNNTIKILTLCLGLTTSVSTMAHHSFAANFKSGDKITVNGVVSKFSFRNPHVLLYFTAKNDDGTTTEWVSEGAAATNMRRSGWNRDTFKAGDRVRVSGDRTHDDSPMTSIDTVQILSANGEVLQELGEVEGEATGDEYSAGNDGRSPPPEDGDGPRRPRETFVKAAPMPLSLEDGRPNLSGVWTRHGMGFGRPTPPETTFNATGQAAQMLFTKANDPQVFCDPPGVVRQAGMTPHPVRITQLEDRVVFEFEEYGGRREIYFDDRDARGYKTHLGDGIARYEGNALLIETSNLLSNSASPEGQLLSDNTTTTEIYSRADSEKFGPVIRIQMIAKDPDWLVSDVVFDELKMSAGDYEFIENDCQEPLRKRTAVHPSTSFFVTSAGLDDGDNPGGLEGADAHCEALAEKMNIGGKQWRAYLSTSEENPVNARDRIGQGPWYNARGLVIASSVDNLHSDANNITEQTALTENGSQVPVGGDGVNHHDILTSSQLLDGAALSGEDGLLYCFASIANTTKVEISQSASEPDATNTPTENSPNASLAEQEKNIVSPVLIGGIVLLLLISGGVLLRRK